jgi:hypothetical protein
MRTSPVALLHYSKSPAAILARDLPSPGDGATTDAANSDILEIVRVIR